MKKQFLAKWLKKSLPYLAAAVIVIVLFLLLSKFIMAAGLIVAAIAAAIFVGIFNLRWSGLELITLTTVTFGMVFGPTVGGLVGFILIMLQLLLGKYMNVYIIWVIPGYVLAGIIAGMMGGTDIASVGVAITIGLNAFFVLCTAIFTTPRLFRYVPYAALNIVINVVLFNLIGPQIIKVMA